MNFQIDKKAMLLSVLLMYGSFFATGTYLLEHETMNLFQVIMTCPYLLKNYTALHYIDHQYGIWFYLLLPVACGLPFIGILCDELNTNYYRLISARIGNIKFIVCTLLVQFISTISSFFVATVFFKLTALIIGILKNKEGTFDEIQQMNLSYFLVEDGRCLLYLVMISGLIIFMAILTADFYFSVIVVFLINFLIQDHEISILALEIVTACFAYIGSAYIFRRRWLAC
ncbi:hypothetical protein [Agathobacter ruminis]|uniref:Uncharacterized protein n=1 Tax=Agathobacter ruminis TaxID=1712665 RepID=A0A2G3E4T7_9FIRM|nr:hypothetical protein [Agathobacter ruminis]MDC7302570.1 hypothetical protein [Agathobacter ruminis]PHU38296.1 hypothetical protein CSX02_03715 [Agathobacter ruminis]